LSYESRRLSCLQEQIRMSNPQSSVPPRRRGKIWIALAAAIIIVIVIAGVFYAANRSTPAPAPPSGPNVTIWDTGFCSNTGNCGYSPVAKNVTSGTSLTWTNTGGQPHTASACTTSDTSNSCPNGAGSNTSTSRAFDSGSLGKGQLFAHNFSTPGTFYYYCTLHPWMHGTIVVI
jgi:plastocyanin